MQEAVQVPVLTHIGVQFLKGHLSAFEQAGVSLASRKSALNFFLHWSLLFYDLLGRSPLAFFVLE